MAPNHKSRDACTSTKPTRSHEVLPINERVPFLHFMQQEQKWYAKVAKIYCKNVYYICQVLKNNNNLWSDFAMTLGDIDTEKVTSLLNNIYDIYRQICPNKFSMQFQRNLGKHNVINAEQSV